LDASPRENSREFVRGMQGILKAQRGIFPTSLPQRGRRSRDPSPREGTKRTNRHATKTAPFTDYLCLFILKFHARHTPPEQPRHWINSVCVLANQTHVLMCRSRVRPA